MLLHYSKTSEKQIELNCKEITERKKFYGDGLGWGCSEIWFALKWGEGFDGKRFCNWVWGLVLLFLYYKERFALFVCFLIQQITEHDNLPRGPNKRKPFVSKLFLNQTCNFPNLSCVKVDNRVNFLFHYTTNPSTAEFFNKSLPDIHKKLPISMNIQNPINFSCSSQNRKKTAIQYFIEYCPFM